jgi:hypothetical protein
MDEFIDLYCPTKIKDFVLLVCWKMNSKFQGKWFFLKIIYF